jgi:hypothetical protein
MPVQAESTLLARRTQIKHAGETHNFVLGDSFPDGYFALAAWGFRHLSDWLAVPSDLRIN